jgi:pimeloyl-ACP methyl ester carboxylesterase
MRAVSADRYAGCVRILAIVCVLGATAHAAPKRWETLPAPPALPAADASGDVTSGDATIHYAIFGDPKRAPVVLLHGGLGNGAQWGFQVAALVPAHRVIVIDSRGQGRSTRGKSGIHYHQMAEDVIAVLDAVKIDKAAVVGWSDGAIMGLDLAMHHPDRVTRVFAFAANYDRSGGVPHGGRAKTVGEYFARAKAETRKISPAPREVDDAVADLGAMWAHEPSYEKDELKAITIPVAIADGDHDELIRRAHTEEMAKLIPGASLVIFADASHFALWQAPDDFDRAMLAFVDAKATD